MPTLSVTQLAPSSVMAGIPVGGVTVYGQGFTASSQVFEDGQALGTDLVNSTTIVGYLSVPTVSAPGTHQFTVQDGTQVSNSATYTVYAPQQGPLPMNAVPSFMVGSNEVGATFIVAADVNGDGLADVIMPGPPAATGSIAVLNGQSNGTLSAAQYISVSATPYALAVGDVDGDGTPALVSITSDNSSTTTVSVMKGDGHGNFQAPAAQQTFAGIYPFPAYLADIDGDGQLDLVLGIVQATVASTPNIVWLKNSGGSFAAPVTLASPYSRGFSIADFNGDGKPDIIYTAAGPAMHLLLNQGNGTFKDQSAAGLNGTVGVPAVIDFNLDGIPDLVLTFQQGTGNQLVSFKGNGDGSFTQVASMGTPDLAQLVAGDFDHDGFPDLAGPMGAGPEGMAYFFGDGHGNFVFQPVLGPEGQYAAVGDFNGDGIPDVVIPDEFALVSLALGQTGRNFPVLLGLYPATVTAVSTGDVNGDGLPEIMIGGNNFDGLNIPGTVFLNQGNSSFTFGAYVPSDTGFLEDLKGKGLADLIGGPVGTFEVWPNNGTLNFSAPPFTVPNAGDGVATIADIDGDGCPEIVVGSQAFYGNCAYQFTPVTLPNAAGVAYAVGDFNGDGKLDILSDGQTYLNTGNRTFTAVTNTLPSEEGILFAVGDFNGDGKADIAVNLPNENWITIYYSNGDGTFYAGTQLDPGQLPAALVGGDFVGDGETDLAVGLTYPSQVCLLFPSSQGQFTRSFFSSGVLTAAMAAADLNKNGKLDLVIGNFVLNYEPANVAVVFGK